MRRRILPSDVLGLSIDGIFEHGFRHISYETGGASVPGDGLAVSECRGRLTAGELPGTITTLHHQRV